MSQTPSSFTEEFYALLKPLSRHNPWLEIKRSYPLSTVELLRMYEWYGGFEQLRGIFPDQPGELNRLIEAYQQARAALQILPYEQRVALIDQPQDRYGQVVVPALLGMGDWEPAELLRWSSTGEVRKSPGPLFRHWRQEARPTLLFPYTFGAAARKQDSWWDNFLEKYVLRELSSKHHEEWLVGIRAWLHLVAYGRRSVDTIGNDLRARLQPLPAPLSYAKSVWYFPQEARRSLDSALLQELTARPLDFEGERLLENLGPLCANELVQPILDRVSFGWAPQAIEALDVQMTTEMKQQLRQVTVWKRIQSVEYAVRESLFDALVQSFDESDEARTLLSFLRHAAVYPPTQRVPVIVSQQLLEALHKIGGEPGEPDLHRMPPIIPTYFIRQMRLILAASAYYAPTSLLASAYKIYDELKTIYIGHDALLCVFLHPGIAQQEKRHLVETLRAVLHAKQRASRRTKPGLKFNMYVRWAIKYGYHVPSDILPPRE